MNRHYEMVRKFHLAAGEEMATTPTMLNNDLEFTRNYAIDLDALVRRMKFAASNGFGGEALIRTAYVLEEMCEFLTASTIEDQTDGLGDAVYFILGTFTKMGVKPEKPFEIIANANIGKIMPDGSVLRDEETNKIIKPLGWKEKFAPEPLLIEEIEQQRRTASCDVCKGKAEQRYGYECNSCM